MDIWNIQYGYLEDLHCASHRRDNYILLVLIITDRILVYDLGHSNPMHGPDLKWVSSDINKQEFCNTISGKDEICRKFSSWGAVVAVLFSFLQLFYFPQLIHLLFVLSQCYSQDYITYYILTLNYWSLRVEHILLS